MLENANMRKLLIMEKNCILRFNNIWYHFIKWNSNNSGYPHILQFIYKYGSVIKTADQQWFSFATSSTVYSNEIPSNNLNYSSNGFFQVVTATMCQYFARTSTYTYLLNQTFDGSFSPKQGFVQYQKSGEQSENLFIGNLILKDGMSVWLIFYSYSFLIIMT